jgi:hypothetical protein
LCDEKKPYINRNSHKETPNNPYVYAITKHAAAQKELGGYPVDLSERKDKGLRHEILINDIHIALRTQVIYWIQDRKTLWKYGVQRWLDGSTHLWLGCRKEIGCGEGSSGLKFDTIEP